MDALTREQNRQAIEQNDKDLDRRNKSDGELADIGVGLAVGGLPVGCLVAIFSDNLPATLSFGGLAWLVVALYFLDRHKVRK